MKKILLLLSILVIYVPLVQYDYVQDDKGMIQYFNTTETADILLNIITPNSNEQFYRPFGELYCFIIYTIFKSNAMGFHIISLALLYFSSLLVMSIATILMKSDQIGWGSAFLFSSASTLHLDTQMWMVGIFDLGALILILLSFLFYLKNRRLYSVIAFTCALLFKEAAIILPLVFILHTYIKNKKVASLAIYLPSMVGWGIIKTLNASLFSLPLTVPYAARLFGVHLIVNLATYLWWILPAAPFICGIFLYEREKKENTLFLLSWALLFLVPVLFFVSQAARYYALFSLIPLSMLTVGGYIVRWGKKKTISLILISLIILGNMLFIQGHVRRGINDDIPASNDGYNHLIRKSLRGQ